MRPPRARARTARKAISYQSIAGLLEAEKKFRKVKGYRELQELAQKLKLHLTPQQQVVQSADRREPPLSTKSRTCSVNLLSDGTKSENHLNQGTTHNC
jgi:hypothetical protein